MKEKFLICGKSSSAHISSIDILKATEDGVFEKVGKQGNTIIVCREDRFRETIFTIARNGKVFRSKEISTLENFFDCLPREWNGIDAYKEMIANNFSQKFQAEWTGFYTEFKFQKFLE